jgi:hypothetical protein
MRAADFVTHYSCNTLHLQKKGKHIKKQLRFLTLLPIVFLAVAGNAAASNIVTNQSFETGNLSGWTLGGNTGFTGVTSSDGLGMPCQDGNHCASLGPVGSDGTLSQTLSTVSGAAYTFSFWFAAFGNSPSDFSVSWDGGTPLFSVTNPNTGGFWTQYSYTVTGTGSDTIQFAFRDDPNIIVLDNVSVSQSESATPEPATVGLLAAGLMAMACRSRRA